MALAFLFITAEDGKRMAVKKQLDDRSKELGILEYHPLFGEYDWILKIGADSPKEITQICERLEKMSGVKVVRLHTTIKV
ncbi:MAG: Lrp/AsnC ligand binding domain-containing protein [archaeon]